MTERIAIIDGVRTPFCKANGVFKDIEADDLGALVVKELLARTGLNPCLVDELIFGNVIQPPHATNIARIVAIKGGLPNAIPALTVNRNCASGMEAIINACHKIRSQEGDIYIAGGTESMTHFPILFSDRMREWLIKLSKAKNLGRKFAAMAAFRPAFVVPEIPKIADPLVGLTMGQTAEILSREFHVTRKEQDLFALSSQERAVKARREGIFKQEIIPIPLAPTFEKMQQEDDGLREGQTLESLAKLPTVFDKLTGTVTPGTSSQVTDGAVALLLMRESRAKELGYIPIGYLLEDAVAGVAPQRMGLGPVFATSQLLRKSSRKLEDFDLIEINEAFAAQVLAVVKALSSDDFAKRELGRDQAIGQIDLCKLNVNGGALALGHPLGASGARLILTLVKELQRRKKKWGLATLCVGGGQGQAIAVEVES